MQRRRFCVLSYFFKMVGYVFWKRVKVEGQKWCVFFSTGGFGGRGGKNFLDG